MADIETTNPTTGNGEIVGQDALDVRGTMSYDSLAVKAQGGIVNRVKQAVLALIVGAAMVTSAQAVGLSILDIQEVKVLKQAFVGELEKSQANIESARKDACESGNSSTCQDMLQRERAGKEIIRVTKAVMGLDENLPPPPLSPTGLVRSLVGPGEQPKYTSF